jgi:hypothetical protein
MADGQRDDVRGRATNFRLIDELPRQPAPPQLARFQLLHVADTGIELIKVGCVGLATFWLLRRRAEPERVAELSRA